MVDARADGIRRTATWLASLAFAAAMLVAIGVGAAIGTATFRGLIAALAVRVVAPWPLALLCTTCLGRAAADDAGGLR